LDGTEPVSPDLTAILLRITLRNALPEQLVHGLRGRVLHIGQDMRIYVERHGHRRMTEHLAHHFRIDALMQQQGRGRMAQVMEPNQRQPGALEQWLELALKDVIAALGAPRRVGEDHILVTPLSPSSEAHLSDMRPLAAQGCAGCLGELDATHAPRRLWGLERIPATIPAIPMMHGRTDLQESSVKVDVYPFEG